MGKITSIITFTGKLGNTVGSKGLRGRHLIRARQYDVKNPRSNAQNVQRMIFSTAATSLAYLTEILNNSFEGKAFGQESLSYARKVNLDLLRNMNPTSSITGGHFLKKGEKFFAPNEYILSQGTLVSPNFTLPAGTGADFYISFPESPVASGTITASQLFPTVAVGDQITIVSVGATARAYGQEDELGYTEVRYCRFAFKDDTIPALIPGTGSNFKINPAAIDLVKAKGPWDKLEFDPSEEGLMSTAGMHSDAPAGLMAAAVLVSNLENNRRSNSRMVVLKPASVLNDWVWHGGDAYPTYGNVAAEQFDFASDVYLNNSARRAAYNGDSQTVSATYEGELLPGQVGTNGGVLKIPVPSMPTSLRLNVRHNSTQQNTSNIINAQDGSAVAYFDGDVSLIVSDAARYDQEDGLLIDLKASSGTIFVLGGTAVCDGVTYYF